MAEQHGTQLEAYSVPCRAVACCAVLCSCQEDPHQGCDHLPALPRRQAPAGSIHCRDQGAAGSGHSAGPQWGAARHTQPQELLQGYRWAREGGRDRQKDRQAHASSQLQLRAAGNVLLWLCRHTAASRVVFGFMKPRSPSTQLLVATTTTITVIIITTPTSPSPPSTPIDCHSHASPPATTSPPRLSHLSCLTTHPPPTPPFHL